MGKHHIYKTYFLQQTRIRCKYFIKMHVFCTHRCARTGTIAQNYADTDVYMYA